MPLVLRLTHGASRLLIHSAQRLNTSIMITREDEARRLLEACLATKQRQRQFVSELNGPE